LRGEAIVAIRPVSIDAIRHLVPSSLHVQAIAAGRTLSVVALIRYKPQSTLEYNELIIAPAIVRAGGRIGALISHIYVDSEASLAAGRDIWGLPKQLAAFAWRERRISVRAQNLNLQFTEESSRSRFAWPVPLLAPAFGAQSATLKWLLASGSGCIAHTRGRISYRAPDIDALQLDRFSRFFRLANFRLRFPPPRLI
jgi:hypothetical protein